MSGFISSENAIFNNSDGTIVKNLAKSKPGSLYTQVLDGDTSSIGVAAFEDTEGFAGFSLPVYWSGFTANILKCLPYINYCLGRKVLLISLKRCGGYSSNNEVTISENAKNAGDRELPFWKTCLIAEDMDYVTSSYAETFTLFSQWCADK